MILLTCVLWVSVAPWPDPTDLNTRAIMQMGGCFSTDRVATGYVYRIDNGPWLPVEKFKCLLQDFPEPTRRYACHVRFPKVYFGMDRSYELATTDLAFVSDRIEHTRVVLASEDEPPTERDMIPEYNDLVDSNAVAPPPPQNPLIF